ncbi:Cell division protein FtsL [hydrothermal vent metagenome]|uniref:Cell division protein FtsL n=1 Tax=hydrothermal vent metagenome TaxID=652676 RepID=A0A3B1BJG9_9ZZZZ
MSVRLSFIVPVLLVLVVLSALAVVYSKHQSRKLFVELSSLQKTRDAMDVEWGQLQLEQSTWATSGRIEKLARQRLQMTQMEYEKIIIIRP